MAGVKVGEIRSASGAVWEVRWSRKGVTMADGSPIEPYEASELARLLLDAAHEVRVHRERHALGVEPDRDGSYSQDTSKSNPVAPAPPRVPSPVIDDDGVPRDYATGRDMRPVLPHLDRRPPTE